MDFAKCTQDNEKYLAINFHKVVDFDLKRKYLICPECGAEAYFRKASKSGQAACFGARPHNDKCSLISPYPVILPGKLQEAKVVTKGEIFRIGGNGNKKEIINIKENETQEEDINGTYKGKKHIFEEGINRQIPYKSLKTILKYLINDILDFKNSFVEIEGKRILVAEFFKKYNEITNEHIGKSKGIYGTICNAKYDKNGRLWINFTPDRRDSGIVVHQVVLENFWEEIKFKKIENLSGKNILTVGIVRKSDFGKFIINCGNINDIIIL